MIQQFYFWVCIWQKWKHKLKKIYDRGPQKKRIYLLEGGCFIVQAPPTRWVFPEPICVSGPAGVVVKGCIHLQWILRIFQHICSFCCGWFTSIPAHTTVSVQQFLTKNDITPGPALPIYQILPWAMFFVSPDEKSPQRETFCQCGRGKTKKCRNTKKHQNWQVQNLLSMEKMSS